MGHGRRVQGGHQVVKVEGCSLRKGLNMGIGKTGVSDGWTMVAWCAQCRLGVHTWKNPRRVRTESILLMLVG